jgi:hypothetical protein
MATSVLLVLALLPAQPPIDPDLPDPGAVQSALSPPPFEGHDPLGLIRAEAADEEGEEEEFDGQGQAYHPLDGVGDIDLIVPVKGSNGSPHLPIARDRRRFPRSPPEDDPHPAGSRVRASLR